MSSHKTDKCDLCVVVNLHDQPVVIASNVEDDAIVLQKRGIRIPCPNICRRLPGGALGVVILRVERIFCIGIPLPEFAQRAPGNDSHNWQIAYPILGMQFSIFRVFTQSPCSDDMNSRPGGMHSWHSVVQLQHPCQAKRHGRVKPQRIQRTAAQFAQIDGQTELCQCR